jgi:hypothetical protein
MKIKKNGRREWARLLGKIAILVALVVLVRVRRIEGDELEPIYRDGDLVLSFRFGDAPFLQLRMRGFDD